jgi:hypothetical protein
VNELYAQLVSFEQRMEARGGGQQSSVNMASKGGRSGGNYNNNTRDGGRGGRRGGGGRGQKAVAAAADSSPASTAKFVARKDTLPTGASTGMILPIRAATRRLLLLLPARTASTPIGTWTLEPRTTSPASWKS